MVKFETVILEKMREMHRKTIWYGDTELINACVNAKGKTTQNYPDAVRKIFDALDKSDKVKKDLIPCIENGRKRNFRCYTLLEG